MTTGHFDLINRAVAEGRAAAKAQGLAIGGAIWGSHRCCKQAYSKDRSAVLVATPAGKWWVKAEGKIVAEGGAHV